MSENRRVQSPLPGQTSITVEPASVRANRINSECVDGFIGISEAAGPLENSDLVPAAQDQRLRWSPTPVRLARAGLFGAISDGRQAAVDGQLHPIHEARIV